MLANDVEIEHSIKNVQDQVKKVLEENEALREGNKNLAYRVDDLEQYGRRLCLRVHNIPKEDGENVRDKVARDKVAKIISDANIDTPSFAIDRAHRIGKIK